MARDATAPFRLDECLVRETRERLTACRDLRWVVGGSCSGKSAVTRTIASQHGIPVFDMDAHMYGSYLDRYDPARHPACTAWLKRGDGLRWALSLRWEVFDSLNRAVDAEILDLFARDLAERPAGDAMLVDGGISHPGVLAAVLDPARVVCLAVDHAESRRIWDTDVERADMRTAVHALAPDGSAWDTFLRFNDSMSDTMRREAHEHGIAVVTRSSERSIDELAGAVAERLGVGTGPRP